MNTCETCKYWKPIGAGTNGNCVRFPPTAILEDETVQDTVVITLVDHWCGEFARDKTPHELWRR